MVQYGFFFKIGRRWVRIGVQAFPKPQAIRVFQDALLGWIEFNASLRPIRGNELQATLIAKPAYGRDYKSEEAVLKDWEENKDFINHWPKTRGTYCNKQDLQSYGNGHAVILFSNCHKAVFV